VNVSLLYNHFTPYFVLCQGLVTAIFGARQNVPLGRHHRMRFTARQGVYLRL